MNDSWSNTRSPYLLQANIQRQFFWDVTWRFFSSQQLLKCWLNNNHYRPHTVNCLSTDTFGTATVSILERCPGVRFTEVSINRELAVYSRSSENWTVHELFARVVYVYVNESSHLSKCKNQRKPFTPQLTIMVLFLVGIPGQPPPLLKPSGPQGQRHPPPLQPQAGVPRSNQGGLQGPPPLIKPMVRPIQPQVSVLERLRLAEMSQVLPLFLPWIYTFMPCKGEGKATIFYVDNSWQ